MDREEKIEFMNSMVDGLRQRMLANIDRIPDEWDGMELRWYIKDCASEFVRNDMRSKRTKRYRDYKNTVLVNNL